MSTNVTYITYATGDKYIKKAEEILPSMSGYFDDVILYKKEDISDDFYQKNKKIFECQTGAGYWLWKPYFILKTLEELKDGEIVFYLDAGDFIQESIKNFVIDIVNTNEGFFLIEANQNPHLKWTKNDCFELMNCNEQKYYDGVQLEAGCCAFIKNDKTVSLIKEWLDYCQNYDVISYECKTPNNHVFVEHRGDQSILTNLKIKHNIRAISIDRAYQYIAYNRFF
jgi:hypothetical protein